MIFCAEDDSNIRELIVYTLNSIGMQAEGLEDGEALVRALEECEPELILLDIMLPGKDGIQILQELKEKKSTREIPIIMVTAKGAEYDVVNGLDLGADDYVCKPFGMMELVSRVKAVLRRTKKEEQPQLTVGNVKMDAKRHEVVVCGENIILTLKEYELLQYLMKHPDVVVTREQLLGDVWGYDYVGETRTLDVHIRTLRQKLKTEGEMIQTIRGVGYRFGGTHEK